ncbi:MAG: hypothetical protein ACM3QS_14530 [Bacteroidota bacterium]
MEKTIQQQDFISSLLDLLDETFDNAHGIYLDRDTSLFQTLDTISAQQASIPVGGRCATLAAQVAHVTFYLEVLERYVLYRDTSPADWGEIWRTVGQVTPEEWEGLQAKLKETYQRIDKMMREIEIWNEDSLGGAMAIIVHSAYHLGEIRQALCTLRE